MEFFPGPPFVLPRPEKKRKGCVILLFFFFYYDMLV